MSVPFASITYFMAGNTLVYLYIDHLNDEESSGALCVKQLHDGSNVLNYHARSFN